MIEDWKPVKIEIQKMFPNCKKYKKCCSIEDAKLKELVDAIVIVSKTTEIPNVKRPDGFEDISVSEI